MKRLRIISMLVFFLSIGYPTVHASHWWSYWWAFYNRLPYGISPNGSLDTGGGTNTCKLKQVEFFDVKTNEEYYLEKKGRK